jgi:hypothetical protein
VLEGEKKCSRVPNRRGKEEEREGRGEGRRGKGRESRGEGRERRRPKYKLSIRLDGMAPIRHGFCKTRSHQLFQEIKFSDVQPSFVPVSHFTNCCAFPKSFVGLYDGQRGRGEREEGRKRREEGGGRRREEGGGRREEGGGGRREEGGEWRRGEVGSNFLTSHQPSSHSLIFPRAALSQKALAWCDQFEGWRWMRVKFTLQSGRKGSSVPPEK